MILEVKATFECDDCGLKFFVDIDPATKIPSDWSIYEAAEDAMMARLACDVGAIENGRHICPSCSAKIRESEKASP